MEEAPPTVQVASCVAVGRFNPAILTPDWLIAQGILPDGEVEIGQPLGSAILQFRAAGFMWYASLNKLQVHSEGIDSDPGVFVSQVLEKLPHTPVRAVGNNFAIALPPGAGKSLFPLIACSLVDRLTTPQHEVLLVSTTLTLSHENEALIKVSLEAEQGEVVAASFNFHRDCASATAGVEAARKWTTDRDEARRLLLEKIVP
jgi:hypothetical protein